MDFTGKTIGFAMCGSFCTFKKAIKALEELSKTGANIIPIMSEISYSSDTRFGKAEDFIEKIKNITGNGDSRYVRNNGGKSTSQKCPTCTYCRVDQRRAWLCRKKYRRTFEL